MGKFPFLKIKKLIFVKKKASKTQTNAFLFKHRKNKWVFPQLKNNAQKFTKKQRKKKLNFQKKLNITKTSSFFFLKKSDKLQKCIKKQVHSIWYDTIASNSVRKNKTKMEMEKKKLPFACLFFVVVFLAVLLPFKHCFFEVPKLCWKKQTCSRTCLTKLKMSKKKKVLKTCKEKTERRRSP